MGSCRMNLASWLFDSSLNAEMLVNVRKLLPLMIASKCTVRRPLLEVFWQAVGKICLLLSIWERIYFHENTEIWYFKSRWWRKTSPQAITCQVKDQSYSIIIAPMYAFHSIFWQTMCVHWPNLRRAQCGWGRRMLRLQLTTNSQTLLRKHTSKVL